MAYKFMFEDILFVEGEEEFIQDLGPVQYVKESFYNQQLKNLDIVKHQLAEKAKSKGANAVIRFNYGQRNASLFRTMLLSLDDNINWYGDGEAVIVDESKLK